MTELFKSEKNGEFYFRIKAKNGETLVVSEGYKNKNGCLAGLNSLKENLNNENFKDLTKEKTS
jgi:uncharacterized protein YegP (UPF0339 family)